MHTRYHYIDWIRVLAFLLLILFHSAMPFVTVSWEVNNGDKSVGMTSVIWWLHQWRIPLLFFISGTGIHYSLQNRTIRSFFRERFTRLVIPLLFAMFFTIPLQVWVEYTQKGRINGSYFEFYPSVWELTPYPEGTLTWSHMWFVVYLFTFLILLLPLLAVFKIGILAKWKARLSTTLARPLPTLLMVAPLFIIYYFLYLPFPIQGSLLDDWFLFTFSITLLLYGYLLGGSPEFWEQCMRNRKIYLALTLVSTAFLFIFYWWPLNLPKENNRYFIVYITADSIAIWSTILTICGFAKRYLNGPSPLLSYLNQAVYPFYIIHQTVIVYLGFNIVQWDMPIWLKFVTLTLMSMITIYSLYHYMIRKTRLTRFLFGMKKETRNEGRRAGEIVPTPAVINHQA